jgi:hypothetical protein
MILSHRAQWTTLNLKPTTILQDHWTQDEQCIVPCKGTKKRCTRPYTTQLNALCHVRGLKWGAQGLTQHNKNLGRPSHPLRGHCMPCFHIPPPPFPPSIDTELSWSTWHLKPKTKLLMDPTKNLEKNSIYALLDRIKIPKKFVYGLYYMSCIRVEHTYIIRQ